MADQNPPPRLSDPSSDVLSDLANLPALLLLRLLLRKPLYSSWKMSGVLITLLAWLHGKHSVSKTKLLTMLVRSKSGSKQRSLPLLPNRKRTRRVSKKSVKRSNSLLWASTPPSPPYASFPPAQSVLDELRKREHFDLGLVTPEGCRETDNLNRSDSDAFTLAKDDGGKLTFSSTPSYKRSSKARSDEQLTMVDISLAKTCLLDYMGRTGWPPEVVEMWAHFYLTLENHRLRQVAGAHGERVLVRYHAEARARFYEAIALKEDILPNLTLISEGRLDMIERDLIREEQVKSVRHMLLGLR